MCIRDRCAVNFSPNDYENYRVGVPPRKRYVPAFTTDAPEFGGSGFADLGTLGSILLRTTHLRGICPYVTVTNTSV